MKKQNFKPVFTFLILFGVNSTINSEENIKRTEKVVTNPAAKKETAIKFALPNFVLTQLIKPEDFQWIDVNENKHLILKYEGNGKKKRGNALLLHATSENPKHFRLIQPLAQQLLDLGWNLFIPNIAKPDYPQMTKSNKPNEAKKTSEKTEELKDPNQTDNLQTSQETALETNLPDKTVTTQDIIHFFKSIDAYQRYYEDLCSAIFNQTNIGDQTIILIANQDSAYWSLPCLKLQKNEIPIVFLQPTLPKGVKNNLNEVFSKQTGPFYYFQPNNIKKTPFAIAFKKNLWSTKHQRENVGLLPYSKLEIEDTFVARMVTGWIEKLDKIPLEISK